MKQRAFIIRRALANDLGRLNEIIQSSSDYAGEYRAILDGYAITSSYLERHCLYVADAARQTIGFYALLLDPIPELDLLFISDDAKGHGVGAALFEHMTATARQSGASSLRIVSHPPAAGFYERMGAAHVGVKQAQGRVTWSRPVFELSLQTI